MQTSDISNGALGYVQKLAARALELEQKNAELEAVVAAFGRPCPIVPVADVPVRQVTGVTVEDEHE